MPAPRAAYPSPSAEGMYCTQPQCLGVVDRSPLPRLPSSEGYGAAGGYAKKNNLCPHLLGPRADGRSASLPRCLALPWSACASYLIVFHASIHSLPCYAVLWIICSLYWHSVWCAYGEQKGRISRRIFIFLLFCLSKIKPNFVCFPYFYNIQY